MTEYFSQIAHKFSGRVCLQIKKGSVWERWTYGQLQERALKVAGFLIAEGLKKGDFAALILENRPEWPAIYLGIVRAGLSCVPLDPQLSSDEIKNLILDSGTKIVFTSCEIFAQKVKQAIEQTNTEAVVLETDEIKIKNTSYEDISWPTVFPCDIASLIYTSGTTGKPKGVMLTHKNICANFMSIQKTNLCSPSDNSLSILPLYHSYSFMVTLIVPLFLGAKVTYCPSFKSQGIQSDNSRGIGDNFNRCAPAFFAST